MKKEEIEFLFESNKIEREYSKEALEDAKQTWTIAKLNSKNSNKIEYILRVHKRLLKRLNPRIAGKIRKCDVSIGGRLGISPEKIEVELKKLLKIIPKTHHEIKTWHIIFEQIHPFEDGNGRTGRILMNIQRLKIGLSILIIHEGKEQMKYYEWFK